MMDDSQTPLSELNDEDESSRPNDDKPPVSRKISLSLKQKIFAEIRFFLGMFAVLLLVLTLLWGHYKIPSESMQPTLEVGDHLYVAKYAYGYSRHSLPFDLHKLPLPEGRIFERLPRRGDVVVFRNPKNELVMIKRLIGLPGDQIVLKQGRIYLNGSLLSRLHVDDFAYREHRGRVVEVHHYEEQWPQERRPHYIYEHTDFGSLDNTPDFIVPAGHFFFMGDNRDNSIDSRSPYGPGYVPMSHLIGRADLMMFSFKRCKKEENLRCPPIRFLKKL